MRKYNVTFVYGKVDEPESSDYHEATQQVEYGASATAPEEEAKAYTGTNTTEYQFAGWETSNYLNVTGDLIVKAIYRIYDKYFNVTFRDESGALLSAPQYVRYGDKVVLPDAENIVKQQDVQYTYAFDGWTYDDGEFISDEDFAAIAEGMTVARDYELTAHFAATVRKYTVIFYDDDRTTVLSEQQVEYGTSAAEPEAPTKEQTVQWVYTFGGWDSEAWKNITGDTVVYATYSQSLRKYDVTFVYGNVDDESSDDYRTTTIQVEYGKIPTVPEGIDTTRPSTAKYDYTFNGWNGLLAVSGDMTVTADYVATIRNYKVTFYNMTTGAFEGENEMPYGSWIERTMSAGGYIFDSWYTKEGDDYTALPTKDDVLSAGGEGHVTGDMTLYGNLVMEGFEFDADNNIESYGGSASFVILPTYANRQKVSEIKPKMFWGRTQDEISAVYVPEGLKVQKEAFRSDNTYTWDEDWTKYGQVKDTDVAKTVLVLFACEKPLGGTAASTGNFSLNWASGLKEENVFWDVSTAVAIGDYEVILYGGTGAILYKFLNATTSYVNIPTTVTYKGATDTEAKTYTVTNITDYCYADRTNIQTVFVPAEAANMKLGAYLFKNVTATVYLAMERPKKLGFEYDYVLGKWSMFWNYNTWTSKNENLTLEWNCDGLVEIDNVTYLLRGTGEAVAIAQDLTFVGSLTNYTIPSTVTYKEKTYTVTELGAQLFKDELLLSVVTIPDTINVIGDQAFYGTNLESLTLPEGLETIGDLAFAMNTNLKYVYVPASCSEIGYFAFTGANNAELFMGRDSAPTGSGLIGYKMGWNYTTSLTGIDLGNIAGAVETLFKNGTELPTYWSARGKVQEKMTNLGEIAIYKEIYVNYVVKTDGTAYIYSSGKTSSAMPVLDKFALTSAVTFNGESITVTVIKANAFGSAVSEIFIPSTVTTIESGAFTNAVSVRTDATETPAGWNLPEGSTVTTGVSGL